MLGESSRDVLRHLRTLYRFGVTGDLSDEQLLDRFVARRDETAQEAFAVLVERHGAMVLGVCRRVLGDVHEAEDAFQATFLILARKAASVVRRERVASWLYGVAVRTAREARGRASRRRAREERVSVPVRVDPPDDESCHDLRALLDEELARLPDRYRGAVVLCELEGLSREEAARRLGIPEGTLSSRLARAKAQLRDRLARRGIVPSTGVLSAVFLRASQAATLPLSLLESTVEAATRVAGNGSAAAFVSASVASLTEGVLKTMLLAKLKGIVLGVGTLTAIISGAVVLAQSGREDAPPPSATAPEEPETKAELPPPRTRVGETVRVDPASADMPPPAAKSFQQPARGPFDSEPPSVSRRSSDSEDRTAALERKLDRILNTLDRLSGTTATTPAERDPFANEDRPVDRFAQATARPPRTGPDPQAEQPPLAPSDPGPPMGVRDPRQRSLAGRLGAVEQEMRQLRNDLKQLQRRLGALEKQIGGDSPSPPEEEPAPSPTPQPPR